MGLRELSEAGCWRNSEVFQHTEVLLRIPFAMHRKEQLPDSRAEARDRNGESSQPGKRQEGEVLLPALFFLFLHSIPLSFRTQDATPSANSKSVS